MCFKEVPWAGIPRKLLGASRKFQGRLKGFYNLKIEDDLRNEDDMKNQDRARPELTQP